MFLLEHCCFCNCDYISKLCDGLLQFRHYHLAGVEMCVVFIIGNISKLLEIANVVVNNNIIITINMIIILHRVC